MGLFSSTNVEFPFVIEPRYLLDMRLALRMKCDRTRGWCVKENEMRLRVQSLWMALLAVTLMMGAVACPLWMAAMSHGMPCPGVPCPREKSNQPQQCPLTICEVSSAYLTSDVNANAPLFTELHAETIVPDILFTLSRHDAEPIQRDYGAPPGLSGSLYLRTHSLLI